MTRLIYQNVGAYAFNFDEKRAEVRHGEHFPSKVGHLRNIEIDTFDMQEPYSDIAETSLGRSSTSAVILNKHVFAPCWRYDPDVRLATSSAHPKARF